MYLRGRVWWISYPCRGRQIKESAKTSDEGKARKLLRGKLAEISATGIAPVRPVYMDELFDDLLADYRANGKRIDWASIVVEKHLRPPLGMKRASALGSDLIDRYVQQRRAEKVTYSTINRELALLRRSLRLGMEKEPPKVSRVPRIPKFDESKCVRKGFFEHHEYEALMCHVQSDVAGAVEFAYWTGCRRGEILNLRWPQFDEAEGLVRLNPGETKNDEPRIIPLTPELHALLSRLKEERDRLWPFSDYIFSRAGQRILDFRGAWETACEKAGLKDKLFHDLRRTGVRNLVRAGVPERIAMLISGHKTRSVFDRYNIADERDLKDAARKLSEHMKRKRGKK